MALTERGREGFSPVQQGPLAGKLQWMFECEEFGVSLIILSKIAQVRLPE